MEMPKRTKDELTMQQMGELGGTAGVLPDDVYKRGTYPAATQQKQEQDNRNGTKVYTAGNANQQYIDQMNSIYGKIMNRGPFSYDLNGDMLYRQMADRYTQMGKDAMRDTMGQAAALTGGYGNSYAQQVGNQAYQQYLASLNDQVPALYEQAYKVWQGEGDRLFQLYQLAAAHPEYLAALKPTYTSMQGKEQQKKTDDDSIDTEKLQQMLALSAYGAAVGAMASPQKMQNQNELENWYYTLLGLRK